jgi:hypothetical protein
MEGVIVVLQPDRENKSKEKNVVIVFIGVSILERRS